MQQTQKHEIDATGKKLGRVASSAAALLMGKGAPSFERHTLSDVEVHIINASKLALTGKKQDEHIYLRYSGYPGGLKEEPLGRVLERHGHKEVLHRAVRGMLPNNKLRPRMLKRLIVSD